MVSLEFILQSGHRMPDENDLSLTNAYLFVNETKQKAQDSTVKDGNGFENEALNDTNDSKIKE